VINQYDAILDGHLSLLKVVLTFFVPYSVSSFSSARAYMEKEQAAQHVTEAM
jgi:hypothetical protein